MNAQIIAITNQKGGVGKTTTTVNLGVGLARQGRRVLLVDGDPQGSLTISMGVKLPDKDTVTLATLMHHSMNHRPLPVGSGLVRHREGVDLLPADIELSGVEMALFNAEKRERVLQDVLEPLRSSYDYILIDCTPSLGMMTINALTCADSVIVPTQADFLLHESHGKHHPFPRPFQFLIEYQGIQHYEPKSKFGGYGGLRKQQYNDMMKREYCRKHNIILLAIPYTDEGRINYDYIMNLYYAQGGF